VESSFSDRQPPAHARLWKLASLDLREIAEMGLKGLFQACFCIKSQWFKFETAGMPFFHARTLVLTSVVETSMLSV
jgi:hypothetical protein